LATIVDAEKPRKTRRFSMFRRSATICSVAGSWEKRNIEELGRILEEFNQHWEAELLADGDGGDGAGCIL